MKRLLMAAALGFGFAAMAQSSGTGSTAGGTSGTGSSMGSSSSATHQDPSARSSKDMSKEEKEAASFKAANAYNIDGTVSKASSGSVTLERPGLPPAQLEIKDRTEVLIDGNRVSVKNIPEGSMVRAKFQLDGDKPVAVRIEVSQRGALPSDTATTPKN